MQNYKLIKVNRSRRIYFIDTDVHVFSEDYPNLLANKEARQYLQSLLKVRAGPNHAHPLPADPLYPRASLSSPLWAGLNPNLNALPLLDPLKHILKEVNITYTMYHLLHVHVYVYVLIMNETVLFTFFDFVLHPSLLSSILHPPPSPPPPPFSVSSTLAPPLSSPLPFTVLLSSLASSMDPNTDEDITKQSKDSSSNDNESTASTTSESSDKPTDPVLTMETKFSIEPATDKDGGLINTHNVQLNDIILYIILQLNDIILYMYST